MKKRVPDPKPISLMTEFHTHYWTCPKCETDFVVLRLRIGDEVPVPYATAWANFCPFCGYELLKIIKNGERDHNDKVL